MASFHHIARNLRGCVVAINAPTALGAAFTEIEDFTEGWEGGLTDDLADNASANPVPGTYTQLMNGKLHTSNHWHTNKGVTWATFKANAAKLGYAATPALFFKMPKDIWLKIAKGRYWDVLNLDNYKSQAIANVMFSWQWGSGFGWKPRVQRWLKSLGFNWDGKSATKLTDIFNTLTKRDERKTLLDLIQQKLQFLQSLSDWNKYGKGWTNRLNDLRNKSLKFVTEHKAVTGGGLLFLALAAVAIAKRKQIAKAFSNRSAA